MKNAALDAARTERRESVAQIEDIIKDCAERNVPVVKMDQAETEKFIEATSVVYEKYQNYFSTDLISQIQSK
jgi:TRAP-type C4-dicarboxylate transport system substrate-binding protein